MIGAFLFLIVFFLVLWLGNKAIDRGIDVASDGMSKAYRGTKKVATPIINNAKVKFDEVKDGIFHPNTFTEVWPFVDYIKQNGAVIGLQSHLNKITGKPFTTCEVRDVNGKTKSIHFSKSLGELSSQQLKDRKDKLFVGKTNNGRLYLFDKYFKEWEDVDLGI